MRKEQSELRYRIFVGILAVLVGGSWYQVWAHFQFMSSNMFWISWLVLVLTIVNSRKIARFLKSRLKS